MIPETELEIDVIRPSYYRNLAEGPLAVAVRVTHVPTGLTVIAGTQASAVRNRNLAIRGLEAMLALDTPGAVD